MEKQLLILAAALALDRMVGEPAWLWSRLPHPVVLTGRLIGALDRALNAETADFAARRAAGVLAVLLLAAASILVGFAATTLFRHIPLGWILEAVAVAVLLAHKSLLDHVSGVEAALRRGGLAKGRKAVAQIVGRDVTVLDEAGVSRAAIESLAENFSDGVVGPALAYAVLGLPGLCFYKAVSTADSMIGHRSPRHEAFGWAAARLDDLLNLIPARFSALLVTAAAALTRGDPRRAATASWRDASGHRSPNAGWPEAATAGALGIALGGPRRYGTLEVDGVWLNGKGSRMSGPGDIGRAIRLIDAAWALTVVATALAGLAIWLW